MEVGGGFVELGLLLPSRLSSLVAFASRAEVCTLTTFFVPWGIAGGLGVWFSSGQIHLCISWLGGFTLE